jgi:hypothetical protein
MRIALIPYRKFVPSVESKSQIPEGKIAYEPSIEETMWSPSDEAKKMEQLSIFTLPNDYLITER